MKQLLIALCAVALAMSACQKEPSHEESNRNPGGSTKGTKLVRFVNRAGNDSAIVDYSYNGFDRLVLISYSGVANGGPIDIKQSINRDAASVITSTVLKSPFFL